MNSRVFSKFPALVIWVLAGLLGEGALAATVATPVFTPPAGSYNNEVEVTLTTATAGATIYYTTDGTDPTADEENAYDPDFPIFVDESTVVKAMAVKEGSTDSAIATGSFTIVDTTPPVVVATPVPSVPGGVYNNSVMVSLSCATPGATIYYTTDGTDPTVADGIEYDPESPLQFTETTVLKAFAVKDADDTDSGIMMATYIVIDTTPPIKVAKPVFAPVAGSYNDVVHVSLSTTTPDATIYYTTDGTDPSADNGEEYIPDSPFELTETTTVKAIAVRKNDFDSDIATAAYTIVDNPPITVAAPVFKPKPGKYFDYLELSMSTATPGATIYYTTDGSDPIVDPAYEFFPDFPEFLVENTVVKAIAARPGDITSTMSVGVFKILPLPAPTLKVKGAKTFTSKKPAVAIRGTSKFADEIQFIVGKGKKFKAAKGVNPWKFKAKLKPGLNVITVQAVGPYENSKPVKLKVTYTK